MYDVVIVGGGPAGLSAALILGRCRRQVLVCDTGTPRNAASTALHGYLSRDGVPPADLLRLGREELKQYSIEFRTAEVTDVRRGPDGFEIAIAGGETVRAHSVLFATGVSDELPDVPGLAECYGVTAHHCPYCDGWEHREQRIAVLGHGPAAAGLSLALKTWSAEVNLYTNGPARLQRQHRQQLSAQGIPVDERRVRRVAHEGGHLRALVLASGEETPCDVIFFAGRQRQQSDLPRKLGCEFTGKGAVKTDLRGETCVPGIYVVGDASRDVQFVIVAAAEGAKAGVAINKALQARAGLRVV